MNKGFDITIDITNQLNVYLSDFIKIFVRKAKFIMQNASFTTVYELENCSIWYKKQEPITTSNYKETIRMTEFAINGRLTKISQYRF